MKKYTIQYRNGVNLCKFEMSSNLGLNNVLTYFENNKNGLDTIEAVSVSEVENNLNEDFRVFHSSDTDYEPLTEEQKYYYYQAEHEAIQHIQQQQIREAKGW